MVFYRELESYKKLNSQIAGIRAYILKLSNSTAGKGKGAKKGPDKAAQEKITQANATLSLLQTLRSKLVTLYTPRQKNGKHKQLTGVDIAELKTLYEVTSQSMTVLTNTLFPTEKDKAGKDARIFRETETSLAADKVLVDKLSVKDQLTLPAAVYKVHFETGAGQYDNNIQFKWPGFYEYSSLYLTDPTKSEEDVLQIYTQKTPEEVRQEYESKVTGEARLYEYPPTRNRLDPKIRNTGNVEVIDNYLNEDAAKQNEEEKLSFRERQMLLHHRDATIKVNAINDSVRANMMLGNELGSKPQFVKNTEDSVILDVHQPAFQNSTNGCWSCSGALLASSRGVTNVTQEDIRNYRPEITEEEQVLSHGEVDENYNYDSLKSMADNADSILKHAPNSMMHTLEISAYSITNERDGYTSAQYVQNTVNLLKKQINHALRVDRSPVSFYQPGHYITIVGIEGDEVLYKDSWKREGRVTGPDYNKRASLKSLVAKNFFGPAPHSIEINWLSDIKLGFDGKTIHGVPSEYVYMKPDGTVTEQPTAMKDAMGIFADASLNRMGIKVGRPAESEDQILVPAGVNSYGTSGVQMMERVYLPKKVDAAYLTLMAGKRSREEEKKLEDADREIYHIKPGKKDPALVEEAMRDRLRAINNELVPGNGIAAGENGGAGGEKEENANIIDTRSEETKNREKEQKESEKKAVNKRIRENQRIHDPNRPSLDDSALTRLSVDDSRLPVKNTHRAAFQKILKDDKQRKRRLEQQKQAMKGKEAQKAEELKNQYTFSYIHACAGVLAENLNRHKHFYLWRTNSAYKGLIGSLNRILKLSEKAAYPDKNHPFTEEDARELVTSIDKAAKQSKSYLSDKQKEMEKDPLRRNDPGKQKYEQKRIYAVLDAFDVLSEMSLAMKARENAKDVLTSDDNWKAEVNHFDRELTSDLADPAGAQKKSIENRLYIPEKQKSMLQRLESLFGQGKAEVVEFGKTDSLTELKAMSGGAVSIGGMSELDRLSNKDFVALAIAASTTPPAEKPEWKSGDPNRRFTAAEKQAYYAGQTFYNTLTATKDTIGNCAGEIQKSRELAMDAMKAYQRGDKNPLARLIAAGIKNLTGLASTERFQGEKSMQLFSAEMGLRMKGMLERDPKLMEKALGYGVTPEMLKDLKNQGIEGSCRIISENRRREIREDKSGKWGYRERERNYVDLLMGRYLKEARDAAETERDIDPKFANQKKNIGQKYTKENQGVEAGKIRLHTLKRKRPESLPIQDSLSDAGKERELRNRIRNYIREAGYASYSPQEFLEKVVGEDGRAPKERTLPLMADVARVETAGKAKAPAKAGPEVKPAAKPVL